MNLCTWAQVMGLKSHTRRLQHLCVCRGIRNPENEGGKPWAWRRGEDSTWKTGAFNHWQQRPSSITHRDLSSDTSWHFTSFSSRTKTYSLAQQKKPPHTSLSEPPKREQKQSKEARRSCGVSDLLTSYHDVTYKVHTKELCDPGTNIKKF